MNEVPTVHSYEHPGPGFETAKVTMKDGSIWQIISALSNRAYQRFDPAFEARQVFTCVCVSDPEDKYRNIKEAVIKVKYQ